VPPCHGFELPLEHAPSAKRGARTATGARSLRTTTGTSVEGLPSQEACLVTEKLEHPSNARQHWKRRPMGARNEAEIETAARDGGTAGVSLRWSRRCCCRRRRTIGLDRCRRRSSWLVHERSRDVRGTSAARSGQWPSRWSVHLPRVAHGGVPAPSSLQYDGKPDGSEE
jgi:hypothetical protein